MSESLDAKRRALLELRRRQREAEKAAADQIVPVPRDGVLPCSLQQEGLWILHQLDPLSSVYHIPFALRLRGRLDVDALRAAFTALVARHESLRTRFGQTDGVPHQIIDAAPQTFALPLVRLTSDEVLAWVRRECHRPFDLAAEPAFRVALAQAGPEEHVLLLVPHHIVLDGWSSSLIVMDLYALYGGATLPPLAVQPADHAVWQRKWLAAESQVEFWRDALRDLPQLEFPTDRPRPAEPTGAGALWSASIPAAIARPVAELAARERVSHLAALLAAFLVVLHRYTGQDDLAVGSVFSGRTRSQIEPLVGFFANTLVLRTDLAGDPSFRELIRRCHDTVLAATGHQDVPFGQVVEALKPERAPGRNPLFQHSFTLQPAVVAPAGFALGELEVSPLDISEIGWTRSRFDLAVAAFEQEGGALELTMEYSTELFDADRIERLAEHFVSVLSQVGSDPDAAIGELDVGDAVVHSWNPAPVARPPLVLHELVSGRGTAMRFGGAQMSYEQLHERANRLAHLLGGLAVRPGEVIGVLLERGFDLPVAELAAVKAGGAWLALDPQYPTERLAYQISDAGVRIVVTTSELAGLLPGGVTPVLVDTDVLAGYPATAPKVVVRPEDPAYVIYTSGSTGRPKGVVVPHRAVVHFCLNLTERFALGPGDRVLQFANPTFDVSVSDFFATFAAGATVVSAPREVLLDPESLQGFMRDERVTFGDIPPAVLRLLDPEPLTDLRVLFIGMEAYGPELVNRWARPGRKFHNGYGPTEVTITCMDYQCPDETLTAQPPIGRAMANHRAYVLDRRLRPVPVGVPGELYMAGAGLAHGYLGRPDLTAEKFLPDPFAATPGERMYATGDVVRWRADGQIEFLGRADRQVKIRGLRVELGEVEHAINAHPAVKQCVVTIRQAATPAVHLAAYVVAHGADLGELAGYLAQRLPPHMIPSAWMSLDEIPLTAAGKVDEKGLPEPQRHAAEHVPPQTDTERRLAEIWQGLLGVEPASIGRGDGFFALGGSSLQATQLAARVRDAFGITLDPRTLFTNPALDRLAAIVDELRGEPDDELDDEIAALEAQLRLKKARKLDRDRERIVAEPRRERMPCTYQQEGLWFLHQLDPESSVYHLPYAVRLRGALDVEALGRALTALVARHESLRTRFDNVDGKPWQVIDPAPARWPLPVTELAGAQEITAWLDSEGHRPIDLAAGPLFRSRLARLGADDHVLLLVWHHIIVDGWAIGVLTSELSRLYAGGALDPLPVQAADHAAWQRRWLDHGMLDKQVGYWRETLAGVEVLDFPSDRPRPALPTGAGAFLRHRLPSDVPGRARDFSRQESVSFLAVLLAALHTVLHRYTGQHDLAVGSVFSGRTRSELEPMVGFLANTLVLRTSVSGDPSFRELVRRCHDTVLGATAHQEVPFGLVVDALKPERAAGRNPLFQISFSLQTGNANAGEVRLGGVPAEVLGVSWERARFDMTLTAADNADGTMDFTAEYSTELFDRDRIERLAAHFAAALAGGLSTPDAAIGSLALLSDAEWHTIVRELNPVPTKRDEGLLPGFTARWAAEAPHRPAFRFEGQDLTYGDLDGRANGLAHLLIGDFGLGRGVIAGILLERGPGWPIAQHAVNKTGAAWMPLDPQHPPQRLAFQLTDAGVRVVITTTGLESLLPQDVPRILLDRLELAAAGAPRVEPGMAGDLAYVMYTSGSTGVPKGVMIPHSAAVQYAQSVAELYSITPADRQAQVANPCFDVSIFDMYAAFCAGATVVAAPHTTLLDPQGLGELLRDERVTVAYVPPALLSLVDPALPAHLRVLMVAGEPFPAELANRWARPGLAFHNGYGPTEVTVTCVDYRCPAEPLTAPPPIGKPMPNQRAYILDSELRPVPIGVPGQLFMAGAGLARGYLGRPDLTAERFLPDPFALTPGQRMYATGDQVRWRADGNIEFLGRTDRQVKVRGLRIELGEIEHVLAAQPGVRQAAVVVKQPGALQARLVGYVVGDGLDPERLRGDLAERLPLHMVPGTIVALPELPLTPNGKLDHARLPDSQTETRFVAPRDGAESRLAAIWQAILGDRQIGVQDTFFGLGGNSLQTTQLIVRVRAEFAFELTLRDVFLHPTLGELAAHIGSGSPHRTSSPAVLLSRNGIGTPLFFVHAVGGSVAPYLPLAQHFDAFYGLEHPGIHAFAGYRSLPDLAEQYADAVRAIQPRGPYRLGGWSFGGVLALEMARLLDGVEVVFALDSGLVTAPSSPQPAELWRWFADDVAGLAGQPSREWPTGSVDHVLEAIERAGLSPRSAREELRRRIEVFAANTRAFLAHPPAPFDGRLVYLSASDEYVGGWRALAPHGFEHYRVDGDHYTIVRSPATADIIRRCLRGDH